MTAAGLGVTAAGSRHGMGILPASTSVAIRVYQAAVCPGMTDWRRSTVDIKIFRRSTPIFFPIPLNLGTSVYGTEFQTRSRAFQRSARLIDSGNMGR